MRAVFLRTLNDADKRGAILSAIEARGGFGNYRRFELEPRSFGAIPRSPFAYWVSDSIRNLFTRLPRFAESGREAWMGLSSGSDFQWLRLCWEMSPKRQVVGRNDSPSGWAHLSKGGEFAEFYPRIHLLVDWGSDGDRLNAWKRSELFMGRITANNSQSWNQSKYFRRGLTWSRRSQKGFSVRMLSEGTIFGDKGPAAFAAGDERNELAAFAALFNSVPFKSLIALQMAFGSYEVGVIQRTPVPLMSADDKVSLANLARAAWSLKRNLDTVAETSHAFIGPALLQVDGDTLADRSTKWFARVRDANASLEVIQSEIDGRCFTLYGIEDEDRRAITEGFGASTGDSEAEESVTPEVAEEEDESDAERDADAAALPPELVSWAVGVAFGRFDVRLAISDRPLPPEPDPFDPLPVCSAGMLTGEDGLPLVSPPAGYPLSFPEDGVLVDDPGHPRDLMAAVRVGFEVVFGSRADAMWQEVAALLDPRDHDLGHWLASELFEHHLRRYSKSRRKAPILWQLSVPSGRYSVWCYAHRMTQDSLLTIQNDVVGPKLATEERRLSSLVTQGGETPSARERAEIATQESLVDELRTLNDEVRRVAPLWKPDLDDGIVLVLAPLWRLFPAYKAWQKELRSKWDELVAGKYDWAHVAMHLWPERVILKCATDRSIAIAHGLEEVYWVEGTDGKWSARKLPTRPNADVIAERTSPAVNAAVAALLEAQQPLGAATRQGSAPQRAI
jgi:hypothetical protein